MISISIEFMVGVGVGPEKEHIASDSGPMRKLHITSGLVADMTDE